MNITIWKNRGMSWKYCNKKDNNSHSSASFFCEFTFLWEEIVVIPWDCFQHSRIKCKLCSFYLYVSLLFKILIWNFLKSPLSQIKHKILSRLVHLENFFLGWFASEPKLLIRQKFCNFSKMSRLFALNKKWARRCQLKKYLKLFLRIVTGNKMTLCRENISRRSSISLIFSNI